MQNPPERACGITILPIKQRELGQPFWKGPASHRSERVLNWRRGKSWEKRKVSHINRLNEGLSGQTYRIGGGTVEREVVCGDWRRRGGLLVIIWSISTTPAPRSATPEGSHPRCVNHRPPMDSLKSDRNKRQDCVLPLPRIYLRLALLTPALHVPPRNKLYSWLSLCVVIIKCYIKMLFTNLGRKKESCLYASFSLRITRLSKLPEQRWDIYHAVSQHILQPLFKHCVFGFFKECSYGREVIPCSFPAVR